MKRTFVTVLFVISAVSIAMGQTVSSKGSVKSERAIQNVIREFVEAWNKHDAKAFSLVFAEDADFTNVAGVGASGRSEIEKFHASRFATNFKNSHQKAIATRIRFIRSDVAGVDVRWEMTGATDRDGTIIPLRTGLLSLVMARRKNKWEIVMMHNMNLPTNP